MAGENTSWHHSPPLGADELEQANKTRCRQFVSGVGPSLPVLQIDASQMVAVPGLIDPHEHVAGAGGEAGPASRTPWAQVSTD